MNRKWYPVSIAEICKAYQMPLTRPNGQLMSDEYKESFHPSIGAEIGIVQARVN